MRSYILTGVLTVLSGMGIALYITWVQFPVEYRNSHMCQLAPGYQEEYTLMVARGYRLDGDRDKALERLRLLRVENEPACNDGRAYAIDNIPDWVAELTERRISQGANPAEIQDLVVLAAALGRLTPIMEGFLPATSPAS